MQFYSQVISPTFRHTACTYFVRATAGQAESEQTWYVILKGSSKERSKVNAKVKGYHMERWREGKQQRNRQLRRQFPSYHSNTAPFGAAKSTLRAKWAEIIITKITVSHSMSCPKRDGVDKTLCKVICSDVTVILGCLHRADGLWESSGSRLMSLRHKICLINEFL